MSGRRIPNDVLVVLVAIGVVHLTVRLFEGGPLRLAVALGFLLVVPGYALTTAVFPAVTTEDRQRGAHPFGPARAAALDGVERAALSFGFSLVLLPLLGLAMAAISWPFTPLRIVGLTTVVVLALMGVGAVRRARLPPESRYDLPTGGWPRDGRLGGPASGRFVNLALAAVIVVGTGTLAAAVVAPQDGSAYTDMRLLTETDDGDLVAADYPTQFTRGEGQPLILEVVNHEDRTVEYTVVVKLERVQDDRITDSRRLHQFDRQLPAEGTWQVRHTVTPPRAGEDLRLVYLLYRGEPAATPHTANAYRYTYLWIDVSE